MTPAPSASPATEYVLLADGTLTLESAPELLPLLERWLPLLPYESRRPSGLRSRIRLRRAPVRLPGDAAPAVLRLGNVSAWLAGDRVWLRGDRGSAARLDLRRGACVAGGTDAGEIYSLCTLAVALLLGRGERALVHAAAPVAPDGRAWLLVGDSRAGKTTTCANLVCAGWRYASDDHVVLARGGNGHLWVEGLPRRFHLDEAWRSAAPAGRRGATDPRAEWPGRWVPSAPLAGVILPQVQPERPTALTAAAAATALAALVRQSPWLLADRGAAPALLELLSQAATAPAYSLSLGLDTFADPGRLAGLLAGLAPPSSAVAPGAGFAETAGAG